MSQRCRAAALRIQTERGRHVITTGPYRWVLHPGYAAALVMILVSGLALGSWLATLIALVGVPLLIVRTLNEEAVLTRDLPGYSAYAEHVRYCGFRRKPATCSDAKPASVPI